MWHVEWQYRKKNDTNIRLTILTILFSEGASEADQRDFMGELDIMAKVGNHPNIVNLIGASDHMGKCQ